MAAEKLPDDGHGKEQRTPAPVYYINREAKEAVEKREHRNSVKSAIVPWLLTGILVGLIYCVHKIK